MYSPNSIPIKKRSNLRQLFKNINLQQRKSKGIRIKGVN